MNDPMPAIYDSLHWPQVLRPVRVADTPPQLTFSHPEDAPTNEETSTE